MRMLVLYIAGLCIGAAGWIVYQTRFGEVFGLPISFPLLLLYWGCVGGTAAGVPLGIVGFFLDRRKAKAAEGMPDEGTTSSAGPQRSKRFLRCLPLFGTVILAAVVAGIAFYWSPERRLDRALAPFTNANAELLAAYDRAAVEGRSADAPEILEAYRLVRWEGVVAAARELNGRGNPVYSSLGYETFHPGWLVEGASLRAHRQIIHNYPPLDPGLFKGLSQVESRSSGEWNVGQLYTVAYELAGGTQDDFRVGEMGVVRLDELLRLQMIAMELEAVLVGSRSFSSPEGNLGITGVLQRQRFRLSSARREQLQEVISRHLSPVTKRRLLAAQSERDLRGFFLK